MDFVLDASAMLALLRDEPGAGDIEKELLNPRQNCYAHVLSLCEVYYELRRVHGEEIALKALDDLRRSNVIEISEIDQMFWVAAGTLKAENPQVSLTNCFALALSGRLGATVLTKNHEHLEALVEKGVAKIQFIA